MVHALKMYENFFEAVASGEKTFEVRKNDRNYQVGDILALNEYKLNESGKGSYTGRHLIVKVTYILELGLICKADDYVVMSINPCSRYDMVRGIENEIIPQ